MKYAGDRHGRDPSRIVYARLNGKCLAPESFDLPHYLPRFLLVLIIIDTNGGPMSPKEFGRRSANPTTRPSYQYNSTS